MKYSAVDHPAIVRMAEKRAEVSSRAGRVLEGMTLKKGYDAASEGAAGAGKLSVWKQTSQRA
jgi:hypothetical protein